MGYTLLDLLQMITDRVYEVERRAMNEVPYSDAEKRKLATELEFIENSIDRIKETIQKGVYPDGIQNKSSL